MSNPLSREARDAIRARAEKATPGPWDVEYDGGVPGEVTVYSTTDHLSDWVAERVHDTDDAEFIAAARTAVPILLDALDAAEALVSTLGSALGDLAFWFRRLAEDDHWNMEDGVMAHEAETKTAAALASYQEWNREKNLG